MRDARYRIPVGGDIMDRVLGNGVPGQTVARVRGEGDMVFGNLFRRQSTLIEMIDFHRG